MDIYDIVRLVTPDNEDLDGKSAFITRLPASTSDTYDLFYPGDHDTPPQFLTYSDITPEKGSVANVVVEEGLKNPYKTLSETLDIKQGSLIVGTLRKDPTKTVPLRVIRFTDTGLIVTPTNDPTESTIEIPFSNGISIGSIYGFLQPGIISDDTEPDIRPEKQAFIDRMKELSDVKVIYTKTPVLKEKIEIPVIGGTQDIARLTTQLSSAIRAIDSKDKTDSTRIQSLIKETTMNNGDSRVIIEQSGPIMIRSNMNFPPWIIPVDSSRESGITTDIPTIERIQDENEVNRKVPYHILNKQTSLGLRINQANSRDAIPIPERMEVIVTKESAIDADKPFKPSYSGEIYKKRVLLPIIPNSCSKTPYASSFRDADKYKPSSAIVLPPRGYAPPNSPVIHKLQGSPWLSPNILDPETIVESSIQPTAQPTTQPIVSRFLLPPESVITTGSMMAYVSPSIEAILSLPMSHGSTDEIGRRGVVYGYNTHGILTHDERSLASSYLRVASERIQDALSDRDITVPIYSVSPVGLYKELANLQLLYPSILGLINKNEALDRILQTKGDYGSVLYGMLGTDEYTSMDSKIREIIRNSEGKRIRVHEEMARVQEALRELETTLRTLPKIAKHYGSRKEVEKAKGSTPLWDEHLDDDPDKGLYYSDRFRKIVGKILTDMQATGELDEIMRSSTESGSALEDGALRDTTIIQNIPPKYLEDAVRQDLNRHNLSVGESAQITGERFEVLVQRIILGGRPIANGDVALITRHLRTAAYKWDQSGLKWVPIRDDEEIFTGDDPYPSSRSTKIFTKTLHLNKEYRQLSKTKDDLEMIARRPEIMTDPEKLTESLDTLVDNVTQSADSRIEYLQRNKLIDEIPFLYDRTQYTKQRSQGDTTDDSMGSDRITRAEMRRAKLHATLQTDTDLDLYEAGFGAMDDTRDRPERFGSAGSILQSHPILKITHKRHGPSSFISEVTGRDRIKRVYLSTIGFIETILRTPLTDSEVIACTKESETILPLKATNKDAIQRGIAVYCAMICSRINTRVLIPKSEGETPPPTNDMLPSYRVPFHASEPDGLLSFIVKVLTKSGKEGVEGRSTTTFSVILKNIRKVQLTRSREDPEGTRAIAKLRDIISRVSKISPSIISRVLQIQTTKPQISDTEKGLRIANKWELIPIIHNPHPESAIIRTAQDVLLDTELILTDPQGNPYPANSGLSLPIQTPTLLKALEGIHTTRSESLQELLYSHRHSSLPILKTLVVTSPAPAFIGVIRDRIPTIPLTDAEAPATEYITPEAIGRIEPVPLFTGAQERLTDFIKGILTESEIGHLSRTDTKPIDNLNTPLRSPNDLNGALKCSLISFFDGLSLAIEQYIRIIRSEGEPLSCEQTLYPGEYKNYPRESLDTPVYTAHEIVKNLVKGVTPISIQYSTTTDPKRGGSRNTVLTGSNTYFERVRELSNILEELRVGSETQLVVLSKILSDIRENMSNLPSTIEKNAMMQVIYNVLNQGDETEEKLAAIDLLITFIGHSSNIFNRTRHLSLIHSDINEAILDEELNHDRERERQRFIYQLEQLDPERRELARASRALGVDLAGSVARDPRKFNAEYYELINSLVATQEMQDPSPEMAGRYGDNQDIQWDRDARDGAFEGVDQIEGIDFD